MSKLKLHAALRRLRSGALALLASCPALRAAEVPAQPPLLITVEGESQGGVDVALHEADVRIQYDPLKVDPALNASAWPSAAAIGEDVEIFTYSNYAWWIARAELRWFAAGQDPREQPLFTVPVHIGGSVKLTVDPRIPAQSFFVLRVYDSKGRFDETTLKSFTVLDQPRSRTGDGRFAGYGESSLRIRNISVTGGSVTVSGKRIDPSSTVTALGAPVPLDPQGDFVVRQILPAGQHVAEVRIQDKSGDQTVFERQVSIPKGDWFHVALGDLTVSRNHTTGPAELVTQDSERYDGNTEVTGRGAFYIKGKFNSDYTLTMSADTRERPIEDMFSNFESKDPRYLLERTDPERNYPVFGDDSSSEWDAPTNGRFYTRLSKRDSHLVWGNYQTQWTGVELNQFSRALYGADVLWKSDSATQAGERRFTLDAFAGEPGTLNSREEFRGTGGSLYYLNRQDITRGSERVWIEARDATSGITLRRTELMPGLDYELSYLQGRILLRSPLPSVADSSTLVQLGNLSGDPLFLVASYEYSPGLNETDSNVYGARNSNWVNDYVRVGLSGYREGDELNRRTVGGVDSTFRFKPGTYLDVEVARSDGIGSDRTSLDGGFGFNRRTTDDVRADAKRVQGLVDFSELWDGARGRGSLYWQDREADFSGPGALVTGESITQQGAALSAPISARTSVDLKADERRGETQSIEAAEAALHYQWNTQWATSVGTRHDDRRSDIPNASTLLSQNGARTDVIVRFDYKPVPSDARGSKPIDGIADEPTSSDGPPGDGKSSTSTVANSARGTGGSNVAGTASAAARPPLSPQFTAGPTRTATYDVTHSLVPSEAAGDVAARPANWQAYSYMQGTASRTGDREENNRGGVGAQKQLTDRFRLGGEVSGGNGGLGSLLSGDYAIDDHSNIYLSHSIETERPDSSYHGRFGNTVLGGRTRLSDRISLYDEARAARGAGPESLTNAFGVELSPSDRWTYDLKWEAGTVSDPLAGDLTRRAIGAGAAYKFQQVKFASNLEYRNERGTSGERDTWLSRNSGGFQASPDWRMLGKVNFSVSDASQGNFFDGDFVDASLGAAYRPVEGDRWNSLVEYRYYYVLPSPGQISLTDELLDYAQRSHLASIDTIYDLRPWLSVGAKYGLRIGELRDTRLDGEWFSSQADLIVLRTDWHWIRAWDVLIEARRLSVREAEDSRTGALAAVYRHIGEHAKIGVGYNFTDFSDDLTDLSYRSRGPFLNVLSTF